MKTLFQNKLDKMEKNNIFSTNSNQGKIRILATDGEIKLEPWWENLNIHQYYESSSYCTTEDWKQINMNDKINGTNF